MLLKNGVVVTNAPSTVLVLKALASGLTARAATRMKKNSWMNSASWVRRAPRTVQDIVQAMNGLHAKATFQATALIAPASIMVLICELLASDTCGTRNWYGQN